MEEALAIAANSSAGVEQRTDALQALRYLVEPIDNAMGDLFVPPSPLLTPMSCVSCLIAHSASPPPMPLSAGITQIP